MLPMRLRLASLLAALPLAALAAETTTAQSSEVRPAPAKSNVVVTGETSRVSSGLASSITSILPKYAPPPPPVANTHADPATEEAQEIDEGGTDENGQPRNKIVRLPRYVVHGERPPIFKEKELYNKRELGKLAAKRYLSALDRSVLNRYTIPIIGVTPEQRALQMYEENERLENISDLKQDARNAERAGDSAEAKAIRQETDRATIRSGGMDWTTRNRD